jgi:hypothetical protein
MSSSERSAWPTDPSGVVSASPFSRRLKTELLAEKKDKNFSKRKTVLKRVVRRRLASGPGHQTRRADSPRLTAPAR